MCWYSLFCFFFFKQKTAYEMRISDWSSDVCSSDIYDPRQQPLVRAVSRRDQRVSHHPVPPDPLDRRPGKDFAKARIVQRQQIRQLRSRKLRAGVERRIARAAVGELVPRAHGETIVAPIDAVADRLAEFGRDRSRMLDRQIGNAPPRIELVRRWKGCGRAGRLASVARSAAVLPRR